MARKDKEEKAFEELVSLDGETEMIRLDEETVSKTVPVDEAVESSSLSISSVSIDSPKREYTKKVPVVKMYKLNYRRSNGVIRASIPKAIVYNLNVHWPDLLRVIPSDRYVSVDEIIRLIKDWENSSPRKSIVRSKEAVEVGIKALVEADVLLQV